MRSRELHVVRKKPENFQDKNNYLFEKEWELLLKLDEPVFFSDTTVLPNQVVLQENQIVSEIITRNHYKNTLQNYLKKIKLKTIKIKQAIWLTDLWSTNYFHWFTDVLPRLLLAEKEYLDIPIIIPAHFNQFEYIKESLKAFPKIKIIWQRNFQKLKVKELIYIPPTAPTGNYNETLIKMVSDRLRAQFELEKVSPTFKTMISREKAPSRKIVNINEIIPILEYNEINNIVLEQKSWFEQIKIATNSKLLIGVHGAGLTNMLFMSEGSNILEFRRKDDAQNNCYFSLASALNMKYYYLLCDVDDYSKTTQENIFYVDTVEFEKCLKEIKNAI